MIENNHSDIVNTNIYRKSSTQENELCR